jgi:LPS export ABC transporter permease LptG|tara:strand:- start:911 stop:2005 length:1095 start_codon:yes stop_codon:yes gene_type:complete
MKKIDYYILREFSIIFLFVSIFFVLVSFIVDIFENLNRFIDNEVTNDILIDYYVASLPEMISVTIPVTCLVASVFTYGMMVQRKEWLVFKSSGLSLYRLALPILFVGLFMSIGSFYFENNIVIKNNKIKNEIKDNHLKKNRNKAKDKSIYENVYLQKNQNYLIAVEEYNDINQTIVNLNFIELSDGKMIRRIDSKKSTWKPLEEKWKIRDYSIREFDNSGSEKMIATSKQDSLLNLNFTPEDINQTGNSSEEISYNQLKNQIVTLKNNGVNTVKWEVDLHYKIAYSFISLIIIFCGIPLSVFRSNTTLAFGGGLSLATIFAYIVLLKFGQSLGYAGSLSPFLAAWFSNIIFIIIGTWLMLNARK